ncbi:molecular chaperone [Thioalkalivibrio sp. ALMg11]|uniref:TorD/DmsD family molecular chaperone n=1 Tax=Thioalkalivibrio sp. ALMg11 TaxID=1158165 RepID=UPI00036F9341|nr:molecular chaperone TorD family protein [Thioalkalivibrio sp. ALMg11]
MNDTENPSLLPLGEAMLCLGQAFLPPRDRTRVEAMQGPLIEDLQALNSELNFAAQEDLDGLQHALRETGDTEGGLLRIYSRLFLSPPFPAPLNAGIQLQGSLMGSSTVEMEAFYQRYGLARDPDFRDLPDHLALQLQFVGYLLGLAADAEDQQERERIAAEAGNFVRRFLNPWLPNFQRQLDEAVGHAPAAEGYRRLAIVLRGLVSKVTECLEGIAPVIEQEVSVAAKPSLEEVVRARMPEGDQEIETGPAACRVCGADFIPSGDLAFMVRQLEERGLATDHMYVCPNCRDGEMGLSRMKVKLPESARKQM